MVHREKMLESHHWLRKQRVGDSDQFKRRFESRRKLIWKTKNTSDGRMEESDTFVKNISFWRGWTCATKISPEYGSSRKWWWLKFTGSFWWMLPGTAAERVTRRWKSVYFMASLLNCLQDVFVGVNKKNSQSGRDFFLSDSSKIHSWNPLVTKRERKREGESG